MKPRPAKRHPMQPVVLDEEGIPRFRHNAIVCALRDHARAHGLALDDLRDRSFSDEDWNHFVQLIGYSTSGFGELDFAFKDDVARADAEAERLTRKRRSR